MPCLIRDLPWPRRCRKCPGIVPVTHANEGPGGALPAPPVGLPVSSRPQPVWNREDGAGANHASFLRHRLGLLSAPRRWPGAPLSPESLPGDGFASPRMWLVPPTSDLGAGVTSHRAAVPYLGKKEFRSMEDDFIFICTEGKEVV